MLGRETGLPVFSLAQAESKLDESGEILYLGWLMGGGIKGYPKAAKEYRVRAVCAVGMSRPSETLKEGIRAKHRLGALPLFYLQGGFDMNKLHGTDRLMMRIMAGTYGKSIAKKTEKTAEEAEMLDLLQNGGDRVRAENLAEVLAWYRGQARE
jgi:hypothetical protein